MRPTHMAKLQKALYNSQLIGIPLHIVLIRLVEAAVTRLLTEDGRDAAKQLLRDAAVTHY